MAWKPHIFHRLAWAFQRLKFSIEIIFSRYTCIYLFSIHCSTSSAGLAWMGHCILDSKLGCSCLLKYCLAHCKEIINSSCQFNSAGLLPCIWWFSTYILVTTKKKKMLYKLIMKFTNHFLHLVCIHTANKEVPICLALRELKKMLVVHRKK